MHKFFSALLFLVPLLAHSSTSIKEVYEQVERNKAIIIDVREENEIKEGMLEKATWFPLSKIEKDKDWDKDFIKLVNKRKVYLYCRSGRRSGIVNDMLKSKGMVSENIGGYEDLKKQMSKE